MPDKLDLFIFEMRPGEDRRDHPEYMEGWYYVLNEDCDPVFGPFKSAAAAKFDARVRCGAARTRP